MNGDVAYKIKTVAANIRRIRESKGYTQEYLAMKLGISQNAYSKIELGYTKITLERLFHIAKIIETDIIRLLNDPAADSQPEHAELSKLSAL
jgi:transcriptional regulator with XRE-family HTH domain